MARRIEQSPGHGSHDPRWTSPVLAVSESAIPLAEPDEPEAPAVVPPTLRLVGGTDTAPKPLDTLPRA